MFVALHVVFIPPDSRADDRLIILSGYLSRVGQTRFGDRLQS
jgi:hypothetical protein